jgi:hypothetical protein
MFYPSPSRWVTDIPLRDLSTLCTAPGLYRKSLVRIVAWQYWWSRAACASGPHVAHKAASPMGKKYLGQQRIPLVFARALTQPYSKETAWRPRAVICFLCLLEGDLQRVQFTFRHIHQDSLVESEVYWHRVSDYSSQGRTQRGGGGCSSWSESWKTEIF